MPIIRRVVPKKEDQKRVNRHSSQSLAKSFQKGRTAPEKMMNGISVMMTKIQAVTAVRITCPTVIRVSISKVTGMDG